MNRSVDILIPTYNRRTFSRNIIENINRQTYPFIRRVIIADDGNEPLELKDCKYPIEYYTVDRMTIGKKRNFLVSKAQAFYVANMDDDDYYQPQYISTCIFNLILHDKKITGSADMILFRGGVCKGDPLASKDGVIKIHNCCNIHMLNEATIVCERDKRQYDDSNSGEGRKYCGGYEPYIVETDIKDIMICIVHDKNTVDKSKIFTKG